MPQRKEARTENYFDEKYDIKNVSMSLSNVLYTKGIDDLLVKNMESDIYLDSENPPKYSEEGQYND